LLVGLSLGQSSPAPATDAPAERKPAPVQPKPRPLPEFRVVDQDWGGAPVPDIRKVLESAAGTLWKWFPDHKIEPFVVMRGHNGPIVHFQRNLRGEIIMNLDTQGTYWSQFAYQFAHEFCHILARYDKDWNGNLWFEETLCETASLYALRRMASQWREHPPYPNWKSYAAALEKYVEDVIKTREKLTKAELAQFYQKHESALRQKPTERTLNGAMSVVMLEFFEQEPARWESINWLNSAPSKEGESFDEYLAKWATAVPDRHKAFVGELRKAFGMVR
jgi:hypothetical protein